jgi:HEAT repeat protein
LLLAAALAVEVHGRACRADPVEDVSRLALRLVNDPNPSVRSAAAGFLGKIPQSFEEAVQPLRGALASDDPVVRRAAAAALLRFEPENGQAAVVLLEAFFSDDPRAAQEAAEGLDQPIELGAEVLQRLRGVMADNQASADRRLAAARIVLRHDRSVLNGLFRLTASEERPLADGSITLIMNVPAAEIPRNNLDRLFRLDPADDGLYSQFASYAYQIDDPRRDARVDEEFRLLNEPDSSADAAWHLAAWGRAGSPVAGKLVEALSHPADPRVREAAAESAARLATGLGFGADDDDLALVDALIARLADDDPAVRSAVRRAIEAAKGNAERAGPVLAARLPDGRGPFNLEDLETARALLAVDNANARALDALIVGLRLRDPVLSGFSREALTDVPASARALFERLVPLLAARSPFVRKSALGLLAQGGRGSLDILREMGIDQAVLGEARRSVSHDDSQVRSAAVAALCAWDVGDEASINLVLSALDDGDPSVVLTAARAVRSLGASQQSITRRLGRLRGTNDAELKDEVWTSLVYHTALIPNAQGAAGLLGSANCPASAARVIREPDTVEGVVRLLGSSLADRQGPARIHAMNVLAAFGRQAESAVPDLAAAAADADSAVRLAAFHAAVAAATAPRGVAYVSGANPSPWPPPPWSAMAEIDRSVFGAGDSTVWAFHDRLGEVLRQAGFLERATYPLEDGFVIVTRFERFSDMDGQSFAGPDRWTDTRLPDNLSLWDWLSRFWREPAGHFRLFLFVVHQRPLIAREDAITYGEARNFLLRTDALTDEQRAMPMDRRSCHALVYHFVKEAGRDVGMVRPSALQGPTHVQKAGMSGLVPP